MRVNDGGPAFPQPDETYVDHPNAGRVPASMVNGMRGHPGMSLRDYFAGQALAGVLADWPFAKAPIVAAEQAAAFCYQLADAMLAAREAQPEPDITPVLGGSISVEIDQPSQPQGE